MKSNPPAGAAPAALPVLAGLLAATLAASLPAAAEADADLLRFQNGDSLHGTFGGFEDGTRIRWDLDNAREPMILESKRLRHIAFRGGHAPTPVTTPSFVLLSGGDRLAGRILSLDKQSLTLKTEFAGTLSIPREHISLMAPNPHGSPLHYIGPFSPEGWRFLRPDPEDGDQDGDAPKDAKPDAKNAKENAGAKEDAGAEEDAGEDPWVFSGGAYYSNGNIPIAVDVKAPDMARIRFRLAWRNRLGATVAFHASLAPPAPEAAGEEPNDDKADRDKPAPKAPPRKHAKRGNSANPALLYGEAYMLTIASNYTQLQRCGFDKEGNPVVTRLSNSRSVLPITDIGEADFELRCNRKDATIVLYINGSFSSQWTDPQGYAGTGSHLAFACTGTPSRLRVSDLTVTTWNGMLDSAASMDSEERDVVLLTNGTDRFSGVLESIEDGRCLLRGTYATMQVPLDEVREIRFARKKVTEPADSGRDAVRLLFDPVGRLTVVPEPSGPGRLKARHAAIGPLDLDLRFARLLEFSFGGSILDFWDDDF